MWSREREKEIDRWTEREKEREKKITIEGEREVNKRTSEPLHNKMALTVAENNNKVQQQKSCNL